MKRILAILGIASLPFLSGCTDQQVTAVILTAVNTGCSAVTQIQNAVAAGKITLNANEAAAITASAPFCPPNPPPVDVNTALTAFVADVPLLIETVSRFNAPKAAKLRSQYLKLMALR